MSAPSSRDWQSPEFGQAIRVILDVHESMGMPQQVIAERFSRLGTLVRDEPELVVGAFFALLNAALGLPALLPGTHTPAAIRLELERKAYEDINEMPPPISP